MWETNLKKFRFEKCISGVTYVVGNWLQTGDMYAAAATAEEHRTETRIRSEKAGRKKCVRMLIKEIVVFDSLVSKIIQFES